MKKNYRIKKDITVTFIPNLLSDEGRISKSFKYDRRWTIRRYLRKAGFSWEEMRIIVNGHEAKSLKDHLTIGDDILIIPTIQFPPAATWAAMTFWGKVFTVAMIAATAASIGYSVYQAMTMKQKMASFDTIGEGIDEGSAANSWNGPQTVRGLGGSVPIIFGEYLVGGTVINEYISTDGDKSYLNSLIAIAEGEFESVALSRINKNSAENFSGYTLETRLGTNDQSVIPHFEDLHDLHTVNVQLMKDTPYTYTTVNSDVEAFEVRVKLPSGLWQQDSSGNITSWSVTYKVEYKLHSEEDWIDLGSTTISDKSRTELRRIFRKESLTAGQYDIRITKTSDDSDFSHTGDLYLDYVDEVNTDDLIYPNTVLAAVRTLAVEQLSGDRPQYEFSGKAVKMTVPKVMNGESEVAWDDYYWDPDDECYRLISDDTELSWDGVTYVTRYSANPIWCMYYLMTNARCAIGNYITVDDNDLAYLLEMSRYCDELVADGEGGWEKRFRMDVCIDSPQKALDLIMQLSTVFRALPFYTDQGKVKIAIDKPDTPVQLFTMGSIAKGSFSEIWNSKRDIPNIANVQFNDKDNYYQQNVIPVVDLESLAAGKPKNPKNIRYYGTKLSYAIRHGRNVIKSAKYNNEIIRFKTGIGGFIRQCGELIDVAHDVPQWGFSGRIKTGSTTLTAALDREVTIEAGKSYAIRVDFKKPNDDGSVRYEERVITDSPGAYTEVTVSEAFSMAPAEWDNYSFGEINKIVKPARIMKIKRFRSCETEIEAQEYNENSYDDSVIDIPEVNYSSLSYDIPNVENLSLTEGLVLMKDGTIQNIIDVWFRKPSPVQYASVRRLLKVKIYLSDNAGQSWAYMGETYDNKFSIVQILTDGLEYKVAVVSVSSDGEEKAISASPQTTIQLVGKSAPPSDVTSLIVRQTRDRVFFYWSHITDADKGGYEIRYGESWETGQVVVEYETKNFHDTPLIKEGNAQSYWIKAIDTSGNYSENATEGIVTIDSVPFTNIIESYQEQTAWTGDKSNTEKVGDVLKIVAGELSGTYEGAIRDVGFVATFKIAINSVVVDTTGSDATWDQEPDGATWADLSDTERWSGGEVSGAASFEIRTSEDNITWSDWITWYPGDYKCRYFQLRMTLARPSTDIDLECSEFNYYADLPDVDEYGEAEIVDADAGIEVLFTKTFHKVPAVNIHVLSGDGRVSVFTAEPDLTDFTAKLYDLSAMAKTGRFSYAVHGV